MALTGDGMETNEFIADLTQHSYFFAMPCYDGLMNVETVGGLLHVMQELTKSGIRNSHYLVRGGTIIDLARNAIVRKFLESGCDTLVCLDSDIAFDFNAMLRLLAFNCKYPVVSGAYCYRADPPKFTVTVEGPRNEDGLIPISSVGFGFTAIKRHVFEALDKLNPEKYNDEGASTTAYFRMPIQNGKYIGEDVYFFRKCIEAGITPMLDPMIEIGHIGPKVFNTPFRLALDNALKQLENKGE